MCRKSKTHCRGAKTHCGGLIYSVYAVLVLIMVAGVPAGAVVPITVENYSFEEPPLADDGQLTDWSQIPSWDCAVTGSSGIERKWYGSTDGVQCAFFSAGANAACYQLTDHVIGAGEVFTLTFDAIMSWDGNMAYARLYYDYAGSRATGAEQTYTLAEGGGTGTWGTYTLSFSADDVAASVGNKIGLEFYNADMDGWIGVDNVRLECEPGAVMNASKPSPADEVSDVPRDMLLSWTPGIYAQTHDVYFGAVFDDVNEASRANPLDVLVSQNQDATSYDPGRLEFGQTYYWRLDEVNAPPDSTVYKGDVWSFTVEPLAYAIEHITATASSSHKEGTGPENTINGSGLDVNDLHSTESTAMWLSSVDGPQPTWLQYEFDKTYKLHQMLVWNYNIELEQVIGFGIKEVAVEYSTNGTDWQVLGDFEFAQAPGEDGYAYNTTVDFGGVVAKYVKITVNSNWGVLPQYGLSEVRFLYIPVYARQPQPASDQADVGLDAVLSWRAGRETASHEIYFSSDMEAVVNSTALVDTVSENRFDLGSVDLELGKTYHWKINEVNEAESPSLWEGDVWSFTIQEYLVVEDFEQYDDFCNRIFYAWVDGFGHSGDSNCGVEPFGGNGTGSTVGNFNAPFAEQTIVHSGEQSMPFGYDNSAAPYYSETQREWAAAQDWTRGGAKTLTLYFHGDRSNATGQMYVKLNDSKVIYDGDAGDIAKPRWMQWNIDLASFGVDLQNVRTFSIGVGDGTAGGSGILYVDDLRLYRSAPEIAQSIDPGSDGLAGHWKLDDGSGTTAVDSSVNANNGTLQGDPQWVAGWIDGALSLDGINDYVDCGNNASLDITGQITIALWVNTNDAGNSQHNPYLTKGDHSYALKHASGNSIEFFIYDGGWHTVNYPVDSSFNGVWHHLAGTYDGSELKLYIDGGLRVTDGYVGSIDSSTYNVNIGRNSEETDRFYEGLIDDVLIYNRALSDVEVLYLADM